MKPIAIGMEKMTLEDLVNIARHGAEVQLTQGSESRIVNTRELIEKWVDRRKNDLRSDHRFRGALRCLHLQKRYPAASAEYSFEPLGGTGNMLDEETVRAVMALRIKDFALGYSGIRLETVFHLVTLLNHGVLSRLSRKKDLWAPAATWFRWPTSVLGSRSAGERPITRAERITGADALNLCG